MNLNTSQLLENAVRAGASDVFIVAGLPVSMRINGVIAREDAVSYTHLIGCIMIDLANLPEVNSLYDHAAGNRLLKDFSAILSSSAL